ncbi:peroxidase/cytochrome P450 family protein [Aspergillus neoniger CBS 115656]|uniref:Peroxidase n=1 Tax=Aspergillus neoniger (strain CBS 115656) TaxID=1448310 RepID=A0A318ZAJ2_ASPNB|nr:peroxidase [Aspergillus neoniger CBS 115656]PYH33482.1 peroxidase [Aspergillus neoniger CBS 115656]
MLRRFSSTFKKSSKGDRDSKPNGTQVNGQKRQSKVPAPRKSSSDESHSDHGVESDDGVSVFEKYAQVLHASRRPLPNQNGDGTYLEQEHSGSLFKDLRALGFKDIGTLKDLIKTKAKGEYIDDKTMLMERIIQLVSSLPGNSKTRVDLTNAFLDELWGSLPHPPLSYMGEEYAYRSADGSNNNPTLPWLGAAGTPYARSIAPLTIQPGGLPDAGLVFDCLFAREKFTPHPNKVSSLFFDWASLVIHDIFQTDYTTPHVNKTSAYLDLSILYGDDQEDQNLVRTFKDGKLKPDTFSEQRLQAFPPACSVLMVMLSRFHNCVVEELAAINENGRFNKPDPRLDEEKAKKAWEKYDNDLFQTGRLVTCGLFINITLYDYLRTIVNLNRSNSTWCLDPRVQMEGTKSTPSGLGNQCSVEFNLAYRWHSAISANDEKWTEEIYEELMGKPASEVSMRELLFGLKKYEQEIPKDPSKRTFAGLKRQEDGTFKDEDLVRILSNAIEDVASSFGARNVPKVLKSVEILGIEQGRKWNVGSLNEFRKFFDLKPYEKFEDINSDPEVADALRHLYEHPDYVELYPGIVAEEAKEPMIPGVGIAPTYTISRAVLSDAVALVRGDRYYTIDYNPRNLTNWGYNEVRYDLNINQGCVFYKLAMRAFPNYFKPDSIYAHYPMTIPSENRNIMKNLGRESHYSYDRPRYTEPVPNLLSYSNAQLVLNSQKDFTVPWGGLSSIHAGKGGADFWSKSFDNEQWRNSVKEFYEDATLKLLNEKSCKLAGNKQVDIARDVGNLVPVHFVSKVFSLPLKTKSNPHGIFTEHEMFMIMAVIFTSTFFDVDPTKSFPLQHAARAVSQELGKVVEAHVKSINHPGFLHGIIDSFRDDHNALKDYGDQLIKRLLESGLGVSDVTWGQILPAAVEMVHTQSQMFTQIIHFYLTEGQKYLPEINRLANENTAEANDRLTRFCLEAVRLNGNLGIYREAQNDINVSDETGHYSVKAGDKVFVGSTKANRDPQAFPSPDEVRLDRPLDSYLHYGLGPQSGLGKDATLAAVTAMVRVVVRLDTLRPAPGAQGKLKKIPQEAGFSVYMREDHGSYSPFPTTYKVHYNGDVPAPKRQVTTA